MRILLILIIFCANCYLIWLGADKIEFVWREFIEPIPLFIVENRGILAGLTDGASGFKFAIALGLTIIAAAFILVILFPATAIILLLGVVKTIFFPTLWASKYILR